MIRPTLSRFRAQWPQESMGICASDPQVVQYVNDAQERLLVDSLCPDEGWANGWIRMNLTATISCSSAYVTVPEEIIRLIDVAVCQNPIRIRNGFWEFLHFGTGLRPKNCARSQCGDYLQAYERNNVVTLTDLVGTKTIRVYATDARDIGKRVLIQGKDQNGMTVLTTDPGTGLSAPGEYLVLASPFVDSVNQFVGPLDGVQKDQTYGPVTFTQVDPTTLAESSLSSMEPNEGTAWYRRYLVSGIPSQQLCCATSVGTFQLAAQGRLGFRPVQNETDYLTITCLPALLEECMSIRFGRMDPAGAAQQSAIHHAKAIAYLNGELDAVMGKVNTAVAVPIFGSNRLRPSFA